VGKKRINVGELELFSNVKSDAHSESNFSLKSYLQQKNNIIVTKKKPKEAKVGLRGFRV
jgi:hypothetical protein